MIEVQRRLSKKLLRRRAMPVTVTIKNMEFSPDPVEVKAGDSVIWENKDNMTHTATSDEEGGWDTKRIAAKTSSKPIKFDKKGESPYHCEIHPNMTGTVNVI
jgi:plastocyanin